jgi:hypothetical protein
MDPRTATILKALAIAGACGGVGYAVYRTVRKPAAPAGVTVLPVGATTPRTTVLGKPQWFASSLAPAQVADAKQGLSYFATDLYAKTTQGTVLAGRAVISISPEAEAHVVRVESVVAPWNPTVDDWVEISGGPVADPRPVAAGHARAIPVALAIHGVSGAPGQELHNFAGRRLVTRIRGGRR